MLPDYLAETTQDIGIRRREPSFISVGLDFMLMDRRQRRVPG
jgi:hypothetical protein